MTDFQTGLLLFLVGFPTVFLILCLVIALGKGLILFVNKYIPAELPRKAVQAVQSDQSQISPNIISAIVTAISTVTGGKGKVTKIEKM
ncbi:MAG: OadG family protein [Bacteroidales bacterium]|jgi:oxaloacetate decarboxylase gamma subunit|nr:OadG family protein [Bacteroidales bacterium]